MTKPILITTIAISLLVLAGCTAQPATNTANQNTNTEVVVNTNETVSNENTEVDTADLPAEALAQEGWLTYTNDEYGFSLKYPSNYSFDESHEGVNFKNIESDSTVASQENIKFYVQSYDEAPDKEGEAYALLSTKAELSALKDMMIQDADKTVNGIPLDIYYNYDVPGEAFYRGANFFANQDYIMASMVIMPTDIEYPSHPFNSETREWSGNIVLQLNGAKLISQNDQVRIDIFDAMMSTLQLL